MTGLSSTVNVEEEREQLLECVCLTVNVCVRVCVRATIHHLHVLDCVPWPADPFRLREHSAKSGGSNKRAQASNEDSKIQYLRGENCQIMRYYVLCGYRASVLYKHSLHTYIIRNGWHKRLSFIHFFYSRAEAAAQNSHSPSHCLNDLPNKRWITPVPPGQHPRYMSFIVHVL